MARLELRRDGEVVRLEPRAMRILAELIDNRHRVMRKDELLDAIWGDRFVTESALSTQIKEIRRAVGDSGREQAVIRTVHGTGYQFVAPVSERVEPFESAPDPARAQPVVAVLSFQNLTADPERAHYAEGLASDVTAALAKHRWLRVLGQTTCAAYRGDHEGLARLRTELGVDYVVEGTVRLRADRLRVTVNLTDASDLTCRWAERYDRDVEDLFDVLDDITEVIVAAIEPEVGYAERARVERRPRADLRAWDLYHLGISHFYRFTAADNLEAQRLLARASELDPGFGDAHAWWAYAVVLGMTYWDTEPDRALLDGALDAASRALADDGHNAAFHMLRGRVQLARRDYDAALVDNRRAIELNPTFAAAYCGLGDSLCYEGRYDDAIPRFERSVELGTHDPQRWAFLSYGALAHLFAGDYREAVAWSTRAAGVPNCQYWATAHRVVALAHMGRDDDCAAAVAELAELCPGFSVEFARRKLFYLKRPEQLALYHDGLVSAGVPQR